MTFALIGGVAVYLVPSSVFVTNRFINIQTMVHHGLQIVSGIYVAAYYRRRFNRRFYLGGVAIFAVTFTIANILNTVVYDMLVAMGKFEDGFLFNMFYINPRLEIVLPVCKNMFSKLPPVLYIAAYFVVLCALSSDIIRSASHLHEHSRKRLAKKANKGKRA